MNDPAMALALESGKPFKSEDDHETSHDLHNSSTINLDLDHSTAYLHLIILSFRVLTASLSRVYIRSLLIRAI